MRFARLKAEYAEGAVNAIFKAFRNDPYSWSKTREAGPDSLRTYLQDYHIPSCIAEADVTPSLCAVDNETDKVIGVLTLEDFGVSDQSRFEEPVFSEAIPAILNAGHDIFWRELYLRRGETKETAGRICYFAFLGVDPDARRQKVGTELSRRSIEEAKKAGYRIGVAFCTSFRSTALFGGLGFEKWGEIRYHSFRLPIDGTIPFKDLPDDATTVMVKML